MCSNHRPAIGVLFVVSIFTVLSPVIANPLPAQQARNAEKATSVQTEKAEIADLESRWVNDLNGANLQGIANLLASDFVRPAPQAGRFITKSELMAYYRSHLSAKDNSRRQIEKLQVSIYGDTAIARGILVVSGGSAPAPAKLLFTDVFVRRAGKWRAVSAQENRIAG